MMKDIFDELYYGEVFPSETVVLPEIAQEAQDSYIVAYDELYETLNQQQKLAMEKLIDDHTQLENLMCKEFYKTGFIAGLRMLSDYMILQNK